jgi:hypothetical protein
MGYYVRVLSTSANCVPVSQLQSALNEKQLNGVLAIEEGSDKDWVRITLHHLDGRTIASLERNVVQEGLLGADELAEFADEVVDCKPASAAEWLREYFERVKCIYAFQVLSGTDEEGGWGILDAIRERIWSAAPAILQADREGFSNEEGYHILWQFDDSVDGPWSMAVLQAGRWKQFEMDLGDSKQRESFFQGRVPPNV